jgi:hypothetical protein
MKLVTTLFLCFPLLVWSQPVWEYLPNAPLSSSPRFDDIYFVNDSTNTTTNQQKHQSYF